MTRRIPFVAAAFAMAIASAAVHAQTPPPDAFVDALQGVFGSHAGMRASHAKGVCLSGSFEATGAASAVTNAEFLQHGRTPVTARFSIGGGNPKASDKSKSVRGLALRVGGKDESADLVMISAPVFFVSKAEHFIPFLDARRPDPATGKPDGAKVKAFNDAHPDVKPQADYLAAAPVPASYATAPYWAVSAFRFTDAHGKTVFGRWRFEPVAGRHGLTEEQLKTESDNFLIPELHHRIDRGAVEFEAWLQIAEPGDQTTDPTLQWPADRQQLLVGRLKLNKFEDQACDKTMFNPLALPKGITASDDSTLAVRPAAYATSLSRRLAK